MFWEVVIYGYRMLMMPDTGCSLMLTLDGIQGLHLISIVSNFRKQVPIPILYCMIYWLTVQYALNIERSLRPGHASFAAALLSMVTIAGQILNVKTATCLAQLKIFTCI